MTGTAVSQLTEQVVKLIAGLFFAAKLLPRGLEYAAMGALLGISLSELLALLVIAVFYVFRQRQLPQASARAGAEEGGVIGGLLAIAIPVTIGASIMPMTGIIDSVLIVSTLKDIGFSEAEANLRYVALRTNVTTIINMPAVLTTGAGHEPGAGGRRRAPAAQQGGHSQHFAYGDQTVHDHRVALRRRFVCPWRAGDRLFV